MQEKLREIPKRILEWWNKFSMKQKLIICGVVAGVLALMFVFATILTKPKYKTLTTCETTKDAAEVVALLDGDGLDYKVSDDGLRIDILTSQESQARLLLGENGIPSTEYTLDDALSGGLSTTEADKQKRAVLALQSQMENDLEEYSFVKSATVELNIPTDNGTLISTGAESSAAVCLDLSGELTNEMAQALARFVATGLGNETTKNIVIMDTNGNLYFSGTEESSVSGIASSQLTMKQQVENAAINQVRNVLNGTGEFGMISVAPNLDMDFSSMEITNHNYSAPSGREEGMKTQEQLYESESTSGDGGVPGTTSNEENPTYVIDTNGTDSQTVSESSITYAPDESITYQNIPPGVIKYDSSSVAVTTIHYTVIKEEDAKRQGLLDGLTWAEYKAANSGRTKLETDEDWISVVANATGIPSENISFIAYDENMFIDAEKSSVKASDILQVLLIIIILAVLAFVVLRSMRSNAKAEEEEELSVEDLLQSTPKEELEDINLEEKSETRKLIEKFVDENPEAAANLLRNWLNEDWG